MEAKGKFLKKIRNKKKMCAAIIVIVLVVGAGIFFVSGKVRRGKAAESATTVQSTVVQKGTISNTIDASGNLEAAESVNVTIPTGVTVEEILVESGDQVTEGQELAKLNKTSIISALVDVQNSLESIEDQLDDSSLSDLEEEELEGQKSELKKVKKELKALKKNPVLTATEEGIIGSINVSATTQASSGSGSGSTGESSTTGESSSTGVSKTSTGSSSKSRVSVSQLTADKTTENSIKVISDFSKLSVETPVTGGTPQNSITETDTYSGTISWNYSGKTFQSGTSYKATIVLTAKKGYTFTEKNLPDMGETSYTWDIDGSGEENTLKLVIKYDKTQEDSSDSNSNKNENAAGSGTTGSNNGGSDGSKEATGSTTGGQSGVASSGNSSGTVSGGASSGSTGSVSSTTGSTSSDQGTSSSSDISSSYESVAFTIAKQDNAMLVVNVDELDILSVEEGQTASITLDALEDETFEGTVTRVAQTASSGNGSTKYEVEITVPMDDNMRIGMSASATIQVSEAEDTLTIPMTALQQRGDETFVYTTEEDGTLSGEVTVETGLSDGTNVEITSGLEEGDTVYYTRTSGGESDSSDMQNDFMQGMGGMNGNDGGFGGDGNMPSGGSDGNGPGGDAPGGNSGGGPGNSGE